MAKTPPPSSGSEQNWAPGHFDILAGPQSVLDAVGKKADVRDNFATAELGAAAGRHVLDQYYFATGENSKGAATQSALSLENATNIVTAALPIAGLVAAIGVDYEIFGSAAKDLIKTDLPFNAFAVGSLIFASALGLSERYRNKPKKFFLYTTMFTASLGASFIAANDDNLRSHFTKTIASAFTTGSDGQQAKVDSLKLGIGVTEKAIQDNTRRLTTGGNGGKHMLADGSAGNDEEAKDIQRSIKSLEDELKQKNKDLAVATPELDQAKRKDWADFTGRLLATGYIGAWLIASQLLISEIVRTAPDNYRDLRAGFIRRSRQRKFVRDIEHYDDDKRQETIQSNVEIALSRISEKLSLSQPDSKHPNKHQNFSALFEDAPYQKMVDVGVRVVHGAVTPRAKGLSARVRDYFNARSAKASTKKFSAADDATEQNLGPQPKGAENDAGPTPP